MSSYNITNKVEMEKRIFEILNTPNLLNTTLNPRRQKTPKDTVSGDFMYFYNIIWKIYTKTHEPQELFAKMLEKGQIDEKEYLELQKYIESYMNQQSNPRPIKEQNQKTTMKLRPPYSNPTIIKGMIENLLEGAGTFLHIDSNLLTQTKENEKETMLTKHILIDVYHRDLYNFVNSLLEKYTENNRIPNFKIRLESKDGTTKAPFNLIIYFTEENFPEHIKIIQETRKAMDDKGWATFADPIISIPGYTFDIASPHENSFYISIGEDIAPNTNSYPWQIQQIFQQVLYEHPKASKEEQAKLITEIIYSKYGKLFEFCDKQLATILNKTQQSAQAQNNIKQKRIDYLCLTGMAIFDDEDKRNMWIAVVNREITEQNYGYYLEEVLNIISMIKNEIPTPMIKNILNQTSNPQLISQYLQQFIDPQILEQLTSNPPRR